jgi:iron complex outermembrane receptor protein
VNIGYENSEAVRRLGIDPRLGNSAGFSGLLVTNGRADIDNLYINSRLIEHTMNLRQHIAGGEFEALAGFSYQRFERRGNWMRAEYFISDQIPFVDNIGGVDNVNQRAYQASSHRNKDELQSFFGRLNYNFDDRYIVEFTMRRDGTSRLSPDHRWGNFPSISGAWRVSNENFFDVDWIHD